MIKFKTYCLIVSILALLLVTSKLYSEDWRNQQGNEEIYQGINEELINDVYCVVNKYYKGKCKDEGNIILSINNLSYKPDGYSKLVIKEEVNLFVRK